jgi:tetratricopeptide (TPR) repeat protein
VVGGLQGATAGFLIIPVVFDGAPPHLDALTHAAMAEFGAEFPSAGVTDLEPISGDGVTGQAFHYRRHVDDRAFEYRVRVLIGESRGLFVAVWVVEGEEGLDARAREVFDGLHLEAPQAPPSFARLPEGQRRAQGRMYNRIGLFHYDARDYGTSAQAFRSAVRADPGERNYLLNVLQAYGEQSAWEAGLAYLRELEHPLRNDDEVISWEAWFDWQLGRDEAALALYDGLFSRGFRGSDDLEAYGALLAHAGRGSDLRQAFDRYLAEESNLKLRLREARLLGSVGRHREAIEVLEAEQQKMPFSADITWELLAQHEALGEDRQRLALSEALIENGLASADAFFVKGDAEVGLKRYRRAKASFEEGLKYNPDDPDLRDYLQRISALLGEGNNSEIKEAVAPVPLPDVLRERMDRVESPPARGYGAHYVYWVDGIAFERGVRALSTTRQRIQVDDMSGVERFSTVEIYVNELVVRDPAGDVVARGQESDYYVVDSQDYGGTTHDKILHVPVPGLRPGCTLDLTYSRLERGTPGEVPFRAMALGGPRPVGLRAVYYQGDLAELRHRSANGLSPEAIPGGLVWSVEHPPVFPWEPLQVDRLTVVPALWLGDAHSDWEGLSRDYLERIADRLTVADTVRTKARGLVEGLDDPQDRVEALMRHVQRGYVYKAIEFGRRAQVPNEAEKTLRLGYGDCKDHALLLKQLLEAVSVPSQLVLVSTSNDVQQDLPSLDQFNHVIVRVGEGSSREARFFDPTDKGLSLTLTPPLALARQLALVLDPAHPRLERLPAYGPDSSTLTVSRDVRISNEGTLTVDEKVELGGYYAASLREYLVTLEAARRKEWAQRVLAATEPATVLRTLKMIQLDDPDRPLGLHLSYDLSQHCRKEGRTLRCGTPAPWETRYLEVEPVSDRRTPFEIRYPLRVRAQTTVHPSGRGSLEAGPSASGGQSDLAAWSLTPAENGSSVTLEFDCYEHEGKHPARRYAEYAETLSRALGSVTHGVVWRRDEP